MNIYSHIFHEDWIPKPSLLFKSESKHNPVWYLPLSSMKEVYPCKDKRFLLCGSNLIVTFGSFAVCNFSLAQSLMSYCESLRNCETSWSFRKNIFDLCEKRFLNLENAGIFFSFGNVFLGVFKVQQNVVWEGEISKSWDRVVRARHCRDTSLLP